MIKKIKKVRFNDLIDLLKVFLTFLPGKILKIVKSQDIYLISERPSDARDNGYWLFKYVRENYPDLACYYPIDFSSEDYSRISELGNVIKFGSFKHHTLFWACTKHISAHIGNGFPSHRICFNLLMLDFYNFKNVFLQHGISNKVAPFLLAENNKLDLFICASDFEREFVETEFGYQEGIVKTLGFPRYDNLKNKTQGKTILIMPTWRIWLAHRPQDDFKTSREKFLNSKYFKVYNSLLNNERFKNIIEQNNIEVIFFLHNDMQIYRDCFSTKSQNIIIGEKEKLDVQELLSTADLLITDYSSVSFDFSYLMKPILFYKFDKDDYHNKQYAVGSKFASDDNFGDICTTEEELLGQIENAIKKDLKMKDEYREYVNSFFKYSDNKNCHRVFKEITEL